MDAKHTVKKALKFLQKRFWIPENISLNIHILLLRHDHILSLKSRIIFNYLHSFHPFYMTQNAFNSILLFLMFYF